MGHHHSEVACQYPWPIYNTQNAHICSLIDVGCHSCSAWDISNKELLVRVLGLCIVHRYLCSLIDIDGHSHSVWDIAHMELPVCVLGLHIVHRYLWILRDADCYSCSVWDITTLDLFSVVLACMILSYTLICILVDTRLY